MLTIISASYMSKDFLNKNYELIKRLNPNTPINWIVVQNTPESELDKDLSMEDSRFTMIKGPALTVQERESSFCRSIHHAKALNLALAYTNADLILILDPDCFILMPNWIELVTTHIKKEHLVFFGSPYHPKYFTHYRGFPNAICMFIHRRLMQEHNYFTLDFTPVYEGRRLYNKTLYDAIDFHSHRQQMFKFFFSKTRKFPLQLKDFHLVAKKFTKYFFYRHFLSLNMQRFLDTGFEQFKVGSCRDTGYKIYDCYRFLLKYQTFEIFALDQRNFRVKFFESMMPDFLRTFPRNTTYIRNTPSPLFVEFGANGEQFFWNNQFFGFHLKNVLDDLSEESKVQLKQKALKKIEEYILHLS